VLILSGALKALKKLLQLFKQTNSITMKTIFCALIGKYLGTAINKKNQSKQIGF
jgi:hypothetical protein